MLWNVYVNWVEAGRVGEREREVLMFVGEVEADSEADAVNAVRVTASCTAPLSDVDAAIECSKRG